MNQVHNQTSPDGERSPSSAVKRVKELLKLICITRSNIVLYSIEHSLARSNLRDAHRNMSRLLQRKARIDLNVVKDNFLFEGLPLEERNPMVKRLAGDLRHLHINGVTFYQGVTLKELGIFFQLLTLKREKIEEYEGPQAVLDEMGVKNVKINQARYIRLDDGKKVVSISDRVDAGPSGDEITGKKELLDALWRELAARKLDRDWLLDEIRADPEKTAQTIITLLKRYDELEDGVDDKEKEKALETLMRSVEALGIRLAETEDADTEDERRTVAQSMLLLEQELKARSADLKSSRAVSRFIREITSTITTFIDHHQTDKLMKSYLKDEAGLQKTETLLRNIMARDSGDKILSRIKNLLKERGVKEEEIKKIFGELAAPPRTPDQAPAPDEEKKTKKKKKRKRRAPKPVQEKLEKAIRNLTAEDGDPENTISYLAGVFRREIRKETNELKTENRELTRRLNNIHSALEIAGINLAIIGADGEVLPGPARLRQYFSSEFRIKPAFREFLSEDTSPDTDRKQNFLTNLSPEDKVIYEPLLTGLEKAIVDENGELIGLLFREMS